jgi:hypothetical protein
MALIKNNNYIMDYDLNNGELATLGLAILIFGVGCTCFWIRCEC